MLSDPIAKSDTSLVFQAERPISAIVVLLQFSSIPDLATPGAAG